MRKKLNSISLPKYYTINFLFFGQSFKYSKKVDNTFYFSLNKKLTSNSEKHLRITCNGKSFVLTFTNYIKTLLNLEESKGYLYLRFIDDNIEISIDKPNECVSYNVWKGVY